MAPRGRRSPLRRALVAYTATSLGVLVAVGGASAVIASRAAAASALHDAAVATEQLAELVVAPHVTEGFVAGDVAAREELLDDLEVPFRRGDLLRLKVWDADGVVLWSDDTARVGDEFPHDPAELALLTELGREAVVLLPQGQEHAGEAALGEVLQVKVGAMTPAGDPVLVEAYLPEQQLLAARDQGVRRTVPLVLAALLALQALLLPLVVGLARRVAREHEERHRLTLLAARAAETERRAVAAELHDTVVQDLVGLGYALDSLRSQPSGSGSAGVLTAGLGAPAQAELVARMHDIVEADVRLLRGMIDTLALAEPDATDLRHVVDTVAEDAAAAGLLVQTGVDDLPELSPEARTALYLVVREAVRNAVRHSAARHLQVLVSHDEDGVELVVADDGRGIVPGGARKAGHLGLSLYEQAADACGGEHVLVSGPGEGTRVVLRVPVEGSRHRGRGSHPDPGPVRDLTPGPAQPVVAPRAEVVPPVLEVIAAVE